METRTSQRPDTFANGLKTIHKVAKKLTNQPGTYRMLNAKGEVLYIGKAKALKKRVMSYTRSGALSGRLTRMIAETADMEIVTTKTEVEAILLESNLIKTLKPRYNILLRDDKNFPYIMLTGDHDWPQLTKHRGTRKRKAEYFGPFASSGAVNRTITELSRAFMLRTCADSVFSNRTRPCLQYQIKRCTAPCVGKTSPEDYKKQVDTAARFLCGQTHEIQEDFASRMHAAAEALEFEEAALWRNRIRALTSIQAHQNINLPGDLNADIIAVRQEAGRSCVQVFFMRNGSNYGNKSYFPRHDAAASAPDVMAAFIGQFYDNKPCPPDIFVNILPPETALIAEALSLKTSRKVEISKPARGQRRNLMAMAERNANEALAREIAEVTSQSKMLAGVAEVFDLEHPPRRIEVYDNSHIDGSNAVGAMIVVGTEGFIKNAYRKYNILKDESAPTAGGDDFAMMRQVLRRRFQRAMREDPERNTGVWPDLLLIDGGKGHLSAVMEVLCTLEIDDIPVVAISKGVERNKGREQFHQPDKESFTIPPNTAVLHFLQRIRDEAHRFAIGAHRTRRARAAITSPLDAVPGIGSHRKKALLSHFGSADSVSKADIPDLMRVNGISKQIAETIYGWFHNDGKSL